MDVLTMNTEKVKMVDRTKLKEYNIYAGLGGGFGGAKYQYTSLYESKEEADEEAYQAASEEYESYSGYHGLLAYGDALETAMNDNPGKSEEELQDYIDELLEEDKESWIEYYSVLTSEDTETSEDDLIRDYIIEDGDSTSEISGEGE